MSDANVLLPTLNSPCKCISEDRNFRGYNLLVQHVSGVEEKLLELGITELGVYFREVSSSFYLRDNMH